MGVEYSVKVTTVSASTGGTSNSLSNLPQTSACIVGVAMDIGAIAIPITASQNSIIPGTLGATIVGQKVLVNIPVKGSSLNYIAYHKASTTTGVVYFYFGTPESGAMTASDLAGVILVQAYDNTSTSAASVTETLTFNFPSGPIQLTGFLMVWDSTSAQAYYDSKFATSAGYSIDLFTNTLGASWTMRQEVTAIVATAATTLEVTSTAESVSASTTVNAITILYYKI